MPDASRTINNSQLTINKRKGFTLIELLVVIAVIGILATFVIASFTSAQTKSRDARRKADLDALKKAFELVKGDSAGGTYYPQCSGLGPPATCLPSATTPAISPTYIRVVPTEPNLSIGYIYRPTPTGCTTTCTAHTITACLENNNEPVGGNTLAKPATGDGATCPGTKIYQVNNP